MVSPPRGRGTREPKGVIEQFDALIADIQRAHDRGEDIGMAEFNRTTRENQLAAWRTYRRYHCLGPRIGATMPEYTTDWYGDPATPHTPGTEQGDHGWHPACSCGFRAPLTSDTEHGALRRARVHAQVSTPQPEGRYVLTAYDRNAFPDSKIDVCLYCRECGGPALMRFEGIPEEHQEEISAAIREHDRRHHGETDPDARGTIPW